MDYKPHINVQTYNLKNREPAFEFYVLMSDSFKNANIKIPIFYGFLKFALICMMTFRNIKNLIFR